MSELTLRARVADPRDHRDGARRSAPGSGTRTSPCPTARAARRRARSSRACSRRPSRPRARRARRRGRAQRRRHRARAEHRRFVVKPLRFPGGSIGELAVNGTVNDLAVAGARPLALTLSLVLEEGLSAEVLRAEVEAIARSARRGRRPDHRRGHEGRRARPRRRHVHLHHGPRAARCACASGHRRCCGRATASCSRRDRRARHRDHARPRGARPRGRHRVGHALAVACRRRAARGRGPGSALPARRHARRGGLGAERARALLRGCDGRARGGRARPRRRSRAPPRSSGSTRCMWRTRASWSRSSHQSVRARAGRAAGHARRLRGRRDRARSEREPPGMVLVETAFGGRRVMDQLVGDPLPRIC